MNPYLVNVLPHTPVILRRLIQGIPVERLDEPTYPDRFSVREVIAHLADWEPILLERMRTALQQPGSKIEAYDEGEMATANRYHERDIAADLARFEIARTETVRFLKGVHGDQWGRSVIHPERGVMSLYDQANLLLGHDLYHVEQITSLLEK